MSGNDDEDSNDQYETSIGQSPALMRSNKDQGASGSGSSPKKGASDDENEEEEKKGKESTQRNVVVIHQPHVLLLLKVIHLKKRKKASKKRKNHRSKKSLSSSNKSDTETDLDTETFKVILEADKCKHYLPTKMANYANEQFYSYVKDTDIKQQILLTNPVPENLNKARKLDEFVKNILKEKQTKRCGSGCNVRKNPMQKHQCHGTIVKTLVTCTKCSFVSEGRSANKDKQGKGVCGTTYSPARSINKFNDLP